MYVTVSTEVTVPDVLAFITVVPIDVAVNTPVDEFTAEKPFCTVPSEYVLEYVAVPPNEGEPDESNAVDPLVNVYVAPPDNEGDALVAPGPILA